MNYLVPVDAQLERDTDVRFEAVTLDDVLAATAGAGLRVVILDACRNNPLARSMQRTVASRSVSGGSFGDLNEDLLGDETLVAYAAAAGTTAADWRVRNSPFTSALLAHLEQPLEIGLLFRRVRAQVLASTNGQQRPHEYQSLVGEHYLGGRAPVARASVAVEPVEPAAVADAVVVADLDVADLDVAQLPELWRKVRGRSRRRSRDNLGLMYPDGRGAPQDYDTALMWFRRGGRAGESVRADEPRLRAPAGSGRAARTGQRRSAGTA